MRKTGQNFNWEKAYSHPYNVILRLGVKIKRVKLKKSFPSFPAVGQTLTAVEPFPHRKVRYFPRSLIPHSEGNKKIDTEPRLFRASLQPPLFGADNGFNYIHFL